MQKMKQGTFRAYETDMTLQRKLAKKLKCSKSAVIRTALKVLANKHGL